MTWSIAEVEQLLETITPGPWRVSNDAEIWAYKDAGGWDAFMVASALTRLNPVTSPQAEADAEFIASAPGLVRELVDRLKTITEMLWREIDQHTFARAYDDYQFGFTADCTCGEQWLEPAGCALRRRLLAAVVSLGDDRG